MSLLSQGPFQRALRAVREMEPSCLPVFYFSERIGEACRWSEVSALLGRLGLSDSARAALLVTGRKTPRGFFTGHATFQMIKGGKE